MTIINNSSNYLTSVTFKSFYSNTANESTIPNFSLRFNAWFVDCANLQYTYSPKVNVDHNTAMVLQINIDYSKNEYDRWSILPSTNQY